MATAAETQKTITGSDSPEYRPRKRRINHTLCADERSMFSDKGFLILRGVFSLEEVSAWSRACDAILAMSGLIHEDNARFDLWRDPNSGVRHVWKVEQFVELSPVFLALARDARILDRLALIYDGHEPRLFKDKLIYKPPGSKGNPLHQDYTWWQGFPHSLISVLVAIDPSTRENGCTELFAGYERGLLTQKGSFKAMSEEDLDGAAPEYAALQPGDVAFFHCFTPHRAGPNTSSAWRRQAFLTYNSAADGEHYQAHRDHYLAYVGRNGDEATRSRKYFR